MSLSESHPMLAKELHPSKNGELTSVTLTKGSHKKVWWICSKGHEWDAEVASRAGGKQGCPLCSNQRIVPGINDFPTTRPDLVESWNKDRNRKIEPTSLSAGSTRVKVWWICSKGHEWETSVAKRSSGQGCPICAGTTVQQGKNDLGSLNPSLISQWDFKKNKLDPKTVSSGSSKKAWWICDKEHSWEAAIHTRSKGSGCPVCSNLKILPGFNDLESASPEVASLWHPTKNGNLMPSQVGANSPRKVWWRCVRGHDTKVAIHSRVNGSSCGVCLNQIIQRGVNDLATTHPHLWLSIDFERSGLDKTAVLGAGSKKKIWWKCEEGHTWLTPIQKRSHGAGCAVCQNRVTVAGQNDLGTTHPLLAQEWDSSKNSVRVVDINSANPGKFWWICSKGHSFAMSPLLRRRGVGCSICANKKVAIGVNDLVTTHPLLAAEWDDKRNGSVRPSDVVSGSAKKAWWVCPQGHSYQARLYSRMNGSGCQFCQGNALWSGFNDLEILFPELSSEFDLEKNSPLTPATVLGGGVTKMWWVCPESHSYQSSISKRLSGRGCPVCSNRKIVPGINDLATTNPALAAEWHPSMNGKLKSSSISSGSGKKAWWLCKSGHEWEANISSRSQGIGCPSCAEYGFSSAAPGVIYFIHNNEHMARKVGIMNTSSGRLAYFLSHGWHLIYRKEAPTGSKVREVESAFFNWIRNDLKIPEFLGKEEMGSRGGGTETFAMGAPLDEEVIAFIRKNMET